MEGHAIVTVGEILVEFVAHEQGAGLERIATYSGPYPSGAPAIFLDQAARTGARTEMFGGVGADGFGRAVRARLEADGVGTGGVATVPGATTGTAFVAYDRAGGRDFIFHLAGTAADRFDFTPAALPEGPLLCHVSAASLGPPALRGKVLAAMRAVRERGGLVSCDPNARPELMGDEGGRAALEETVAASHCLMPSTSDLGFLYPGLPEEAAIGRLLDSGAEIVAVKRGAAGATIFAGGARIDLPGHAVEEVDPTGAGDGFCGTLVGLLVQGVPLDEAGRRANAAGAIAVTRRGPMEGNSDPGEIDAFLKERGG